MGQNGRLCLGSQMRYPDEPSSLTKPRRRRVPTLERLLLRSPREPAPDRQQRLQELIERLTGLPAGQRSVATALIDAGRARTYSKVAALLGLHLGTVHRHLGRIRLRHPEVYDALMRARASQLTERHREVLERARSQRAAWHRNPANQLIRRVRLATLGPLAREVAAMRRQFRR